MSLSIDGTHPEMLAKLAGSFNGRLTSLKRQTKRGKLVYRLYWLKDDIYPLVGLVINLLVEKAPQARQVQKLYSINRLLSTGRYSRRLTTALYSRIINRTKELKNLSFESIEPHTKCDTAEGTYIKTDTQYDIVEGTPSWELGRK